MLISPGACGAFHAQGARPALKKFSGLFNFCFLRGIMQQKRFPILTILLVWGKYPLLKELVVNKIVGRI
jgi:hypothetical protein